MKKYKISILLSEDKYQRSTPGTELWKEAELLEEPIKKIGKELKDNILISLADDYYLRIKLIEYKNKPSFTLNKILENEEVMFFGQQELSTRGKIDKYVMDDFCVLKIFPAGESFDDFWYDTEKYSKVAAIQNHITEEIGNSRLEIRAGSFKDIAILIENVLQIHQFLANEIKDKFWDFELRYENNFNEITIRSIQLIDSGK